METRHTPTPWSYSGPYGRDGWHGYVVHDAKGERVAQGVLSQEDAALIVRAVNAHDELVAALNHLLAVDVASEAGRYRSDRTQAQVAARAALAKAKGE